MLLMGGLGNQIFQICKSKELQDNGYEVTIDTSNFSKYKSSKEDLFIHREQILNIQDFKFKESNRLIKILLNSFINLEKKRLIPNFLNPCNLIHDNNISTIDFKKFNKMIGYFQDVDLIYKYKEFLINSLSENEIIRNSFNQTSIKGSTMLHVRRGDYLNLDEALNLHFYKEAIDYCSKNIENFTFEVFTDDSEWVKKQNIFDNALKIHNDDISKENTIISFSNMIQKENFIIGNSTFSLIAAILGSSQYSKFIVADPWFRNKSKNLNFKNNWIKIKNQKYT